MKTIYLIALLSFSGHLFAQTTDSAVDKSVQFKVGIDYTSALNYYGRTDAAAVSGITPKAEIWFSGAAYISASPVFVSGTNNKFSYAGTMVTAGYQHASENWFTNLYILKPFYPGTGKLVQSSMKAETGLQLSNLNPVLNVSAGGNLTWNESMDYGVNFGLDHNFSIDIKDGSSFSLNPMVFAYGGSQHFSNSYIRRKTGLPVLGGTEMATKESSRFSILAYEASLPLSYTRGGLTISITPSYVIPQNLIVDPAHPELSEKGSPMFYAMVGAIYSF